MRVLSLDRGFYFIVVVWGERFRDQFLEYCLPSLLSPGNLPTLNTRQPSKFLIATRPDDWEAMRATAIFGQLERFVAPVFIEIPSCPPERSGREHMGLGHKLCCDIAHHEKAYGLILTPDCMLSDGAVRRLQNLASARAELVLSATLRFEEESFFAILRQETGLLDEARQISGQALCLSGRQLVSAALKGMHSETLGYEWDAPYFAPLPAGAWWRVPEEEGIVVHAQCWLPLLMDYSVVADHDTTTFANWTIDGDYFFKNFGQSRAIHVVQDSDEIFIASWGPASDRPYHLNRHPLLGEIGKGATFRSAFHGPIFDPLKRRTFFLPVRWHTQAINENWVATEHRALRTLLTYVTPPNDLCSLDSAISSLSSSRSGARDAANIVRAEWEKLGLWRREPLRAIWFVALSLVAVIERLKRLKWEWTVEGHGARHRIGKALHGDRVAQRWVMWRFRVLIRQILGRSLNLPMPPLPD